MLTKPTFALLVEKSVPIERYQFALLESNNKEKKLWYTQLKKVYEKEELQQEYERGYRKGFRKGYDFGYKKGKRTALINSAWKGFTASLTACCVGCIIGGLILLVGH